MNDEDLALVRGCLRGDRQAFEQVVDRYQKPIYNAAYRIVGRREDAEDVTQQVFINAFKSLRSFNEKKSFFSWLYRIAVNESLNKLKSLASREIFDETDHGHDETPDDVYHKKELQLAVQHALGRLTNEHRTVVVLRHFQDLSYDEIAEILELPVKTVKSRLYEARQQLKDILILHRQI